MRNWSEFRLCYRKGYSFKDAVFCCDLEMTALEYARTLWARWENGG